MFAGNQELLDRVRSKRLLVAVCGGIAAYKVAGVVSTLAQAGAEVHVAMTACATAFVGPLTFQALSGRPVFQGVLDQFDHADPQHTRLASDLDGVLVAPCTMNMLAKLANGLADDAVSTLLAAIDRTKTPVVLAPSMNAAMWDQPATQRNLQTLTSDGYSLVSPGEGWQACRTIGTGRLPEPDTLVEALAAAVSNV
jgi:phosphopantothenoylcysteine decarboxylase/phosphopantothenate--cysteine ligase